MSRFDDLKIRYTEQMAKADGSMAQYYGGVMLGIELAAGAIAQDRQEELEERVRSLQSTVDSLSSTTRSWQRPAPLGDRKKDMDQPVEIYYLADPRDDSPFYVGSASSAVDQVNDYMRTPNAKVSCKEILNELADNNLRPTVNVTQTGIRLADANGAKAQLIQQLQAKGATLTNMR